MVTRGIAPRLIRHILIIAISTLILAQVAIGADPKLGFLAVAPAADKLGPEARAALALASKLATTTLILVPADGAFVDESLRPVNLNAFDVLWYHEGDTAAQTTPHGARSFPILRKYVSDGGRLLLSGAALSLVNTMGVEPAKARRFNGARDNYIARIIPVETTHPIFRGLSPVADLETGPIPITSSGYPAFADYLGAGGPTTGMLLARADCSAENPIAEYQLGKGRIIVLGWRLAHYSDAANAHRANLERLTANILSYLADSSQWQKIVIKSSSPVPAAQIGISSSQWDSLELAITDLSQTFGQRYPNGPDYLRQLKSLRESHDKLLPTIASASRTLDPATRQLRAELTGQFEALRRDALLDNPLMKFDRLLLIERNAGNLGLPANWESNSSLSTSGFDNRLRILAPPRPDGTLTTIYQPPAGRFVGDLKLHFDGDRLLFSMPGSNGRWQVHELNLDALDSANQPKPRELPLIHEPDVDNYDACYLPDGRIIFSSTAPFIGVPCVYGSSHMTNLYLLERDGSIRQLTFDQEHNWCPTVLNNGRVLYLRWEYTDLPHSHSRRLFHMNPDGTGQMEFISSNSYLPNSFFYARPIPGHPTKVVGIVTGHHGNARWAAADLSTPRAAARRPTAPCRRSPATARESPRSSATSWPTASGPSSCIRIR